MNVTKEMIKDKKKKKTGTHIYIPSVKYPHLHVHKNFIVYSTSGNSHQPLFTGDEKYSENISACLAAESDDEAKILVLKYLENLS